MAETSSAFHVMSKPTGAICNLDGSGFRMGLDFFRHVDEPMRVMAGLLRQGAGATGVRDWYVDRDAERPGDAPCTCGSGRTWAECHGAAPATPSPPMVSSGTERRRRDG